ncbi:MAG: FmdB family zinc ribbon protein [Candidatus Geothermincolia bacterium]
MPIYEYECSSCGERSQRLQQVGEDSTGRKCLTCGDGVIRKVMSVFGAPGTGQNSCDTGERSRYR